MLTSSLLAGALAGAGLYALLRVFLRPQPGVQVADVVLPDHRHRPGRPDVRVGEGLGGQLGVLQHPDPGQRADLRPVVQPPGRQDHRHPLAVPGRQLLRDAIGQRPVAADDVMAAMAVGAPGERGHAVIITGVDMITAP